MKRTRAERKEGRRATKRLERFRRGEWSRLRADAMRWDLSETVTMESLRREAVAIAGDRVPDDMFIEAGVIVWITSGRWGWTVRSGTVTAYINRNL